jgi:hypothetical protein
MNYLNCAPSPQSKSTAILDTGCTVHFLIANAPCKEKQVAGPPLEFRLPYDAVIAYTHTTTLDLPSLSTAAIQAHILPGLAEHSLLGVEPGTEQN